MFRLSPDLLIRAQGLAAPKDAPAVSVSVKSNLVSFSAYTEKGFCHLGPKEICGSQGVLT